MSNRLSTLWSLEPRSATQCLVVGGLPRRMSSYMLAYPDRALCRYFAV
jgi:hypothetical protein